MSNKILIHNTRKKNFVNYLDIKSTYFEMGRKGKRDCSSQYKTNTRSVVNILLLLAQLKKRFYLRLINIAKAAEIWRNSVHVESKKRSLGLSNISVICNNLTHEMFSQIAKDKYMRIVSVDIDIQLQIVWI